jgi:NAD(P)-dependent dehydrogenase (short-subunit alcohol dehydrogenase family)
MEFSGAVAAITGAAGGIGYAGVTIAMPSII